MSETPVPEHAWCNRIEPVVVARGNQLCIDVDGACFHSHVCGWGCDVCVVVRRHGAGKQEMESSLRDASFVGFVAYHRLAGLEWAVCHWPADDMPV